jgi:hypothetical protein
MFLYVSLPCLTPSEQLAACDALIDLAAIEIASHMTLENVIDEIFCDPPPYVPFPALVDYVADNMTQPSQSYQSRGGDHPGKSRQCSNPVPIAEDT